MDSLLAAANQLGDPPFLLLTTMSQLEALITRGAAAALAELEKKNKGEKRLTTAEAARFLGCSTYHLQDLHKQGLPYEKGRPNYYRLADLEAWQASRRLQQI